MKCKAFGPLLSAYIDDELSGFEKSSLADHIKNCSYCQNEIQDLRRVQKAVLLTKISEQKPFFETRVMNYIAKQGSAPFFLTSFISAAKNIIYVAAGIFAIIIGLNSQYSPQTANKGYSGLEEYVLQKAPDTEISKNDILSLALLDTTEVIENE